MAFTNNYTSFGRNPAQGSQKVILYKWRHENIFDRLDNAIPALPYGLGKSYGDSCLNEDGTLIDCSKLNKFIHFDRAEGVILCEAGVTLKEIINVVLPTGFFLPTTPGTKYITLGGAIANDVHGKNHHSAGTIACSILEFELLRSDGNRYICSPNINSELFYATIGGLGLTGIITWAKLKLQKVPSAYIKQESIKFYSLDEFFEINEASEHSYEFTVSWIDPKLKRGNIKGIYMRGNYALSDETPQKTHSSIAPIALPISAPLINLSTIAIFNKLYFAKQLKKSQQSIVHYDNYFYPLDSLLNWNNLYGKRGFYQYQFVIPHENSKKNLNCILSIFNEYGLNSFLTVLKSFGNLTSRGMMSFPAPGITLAIDFPATAPNVLKAMHEADSIVSACGGKLYPAKDARMSSRDFMQFYPQWEAFSKFIDIKLSSSFWRRVTSEAK